MADSTKLRTELDLCSQTLSEGSFTVDPDLTLIRSYYRDYVSGYTSLCAKSAAFGRRRKGSLMFETKPYVPKTQCPVSGEPDRSTRATSHGKYLAM